MNGNNREIEENQIKENGMGLDSKEPADKKIDNKKIASKKIDNVGGILMISATLIAIILANNVSWYYELINYPFLPVSYSSFPILPSVAPSITLSIAPSLKIIVRDILMVIFFAYIGMELKYEFHSGSLADKRQILLPLLAATGGMIMPAVIYLFINSSYPSHYAGFAIPCATDIAFAICLYNLAGNFLPPAIKIFLLSIAIFDDLGAIIIIAIFYSSDFNIIWLLLSIVLLACIWLVASKNITSTYLYVLMGVVLSICFHNAGLHTTLAGFLTGFLMPLTKMHSPVHFQDHSTALVSEKPILQAEDAGSLKELSSKIHPWVQLLILPLFAFTSSGINFSDSKSIDPANPILAGILLGLFLGKPLGISLFSYLTIKLRWALLPQGSRFSDIFIVSIFGGIGFTMSLFIGLLAFHDIPTQCLVKTGVIAGSLMSVITVILVKIVISFNKNRADKRKNFIS